MVRIKSFEHGRGNYCPRVVPALLEFPTHGYACPLQGSMSTPDRYLRYRSHLSMMQSYKLFNRARATRHNRIQDFRQGLYLRKGMTIGVRRRCNLSPGRHHFGMKWAPILRV